MPLPSFFEATLVQSFRGNTTVNRWNYLGQGTPTAIQPSFGLFMAMGGSTGHVSGTLLGKLKAMQSNDCFFVELAVRNLFDPIDFYTFPYASGVAGLNTSESEPPFVTVGFRTNRIRTDIRRGTKRFSGVPSGFLGAGGLLDGASTIPVGDVAEVMGEVLEYLDEGSPLTYTPCVLGRETYVTPSGNRAYRYYPTFALQQAHAAVGVTWQPYSQVRSQTSRQYGRGI